MDYLIKTSAQLGPLLAGMRRQRKLTQTAAGTKVGLAQNAVSALETDASKASLDRIFRLLSALELDFVIRDRRAKTPPASSW